MTTWRIVHIVAGIFVLSGLLLGSPRSPLYVSEWWLVLSAFTGANLLQSGLTQWCLLESILRKLGVKAGV